MKFYKLDKPPGYEGSASSISGSCGSEKAWFDFVPDRFIGVVITEPCRIHDYDYTIGGTEKDRYKADRRFRKNLRACVLNDESLIFRDTNLHLCELYYKMVRKHGASSFNFHT